MTRTALIALAGTAIVLAGPVMAQSASQSPAPPQGSAPAQAAAPQPGENVAAVANTMNADAQSTDTKADPKAKTKAADNTTCTPITAGPNQGQFIGKCKHKR